MTQPTAPDSSLPPAPPSSDASTADAGLGNDPGVTRTYTPTKVSGGATGLPTIPGYAVESELGHGGMGIVYKARHLALKRSVALKVLRGTIHADAAEHARFKAEAEAVARLQHPNIVQVFEVGEHDGLPFCTLEFVDGGSLSQKLAGQPLPPTEAARLVEALARAMHLAHSRNVIHRDLKPANVLLTTHGVPKVTDFGLAKQLDADSGHWATGNPR